MRTGARCEFQRSNAVERRKLLVREDQVNFIVFKRSHKLGAGLNAGNFTNETFRLKKSLNVLRVA